MIRTLAHICFTVSDLPRSETFYVDALGLQVAFEFHNDAGKRFGLYVAAGERTFIELFAGDPATAPATGSYQHLCLEVDDIEQTVNDIRSHGVEVGDISMGSDGSYQAWLSDPDGNRIELHQYMPDSRQTQYLNSR